VIQEQFHEVSEALFVREGQVGVGYRLLSETHNVKMLEKGSVVNDYGCLSDDGVSEFVYTAISSSPVEGYSIRKASF